MATFTNQATLSYNGNTTTSNITTGEILEVLSVTKTAVVNTYSANDRITYVISIVNSGATALNGLTVTDDLGGYTLPDGTTQVYPLTYEQKSVQYFINGVRQTAAPAVVAGPPMTFSGISVPAGGNTVLIYETRVNQNAPLTTDSSITNRAAVSGGGLTTPVADTEIVAASNEPLLTISKSLNPTTVTENGQVTYTFVIQNAGNTAAQGDDNVIVTDIFNPALNAISVTFNGITWTEDTHYTYNAATGTFSTLPGQITVPAAAYTQDPTTGAWTTNPGVSVLTVTGTI
ncbi:hypothetical protein AALB53_01655 [Lachnospiraceae bacterium 47-T17]